MPDRDAEPISGSHSELAALQVQQHTLQNGARFVAGRGESHLVDHLFEFRYIELDTFCQGRYRHGGKFLGVDTFDISYRAPAAYIEGLRTGVHCQVDLIAGERADKISKGARRHSYGAFLLNLGAYPGGDAQFQVCGRKSQWLPARFPIRVKCCVVKPRVKPCSTPG